MTTDQEAEAFLEQDLSDLDFSQFTPVKFEFQTKAPPLNMRLPAPLLNAVKAHALARGIHYTRFIREVLEQALTAPVDITADIVWSDSKLTEGRFDANGDIDEREPA